jgi:DNA-binding CsgD family transcriptional regulator
MEDLVAAKTWAERAREDARAGAGGLGPPLAFALLAEAEILHATGFPAEAALTAQEAQDRLAETGNVLAAARAGLLAGRAHAAAGARDLAVLVLEKAQVSFRGCGAVSLRDETARELRRLGRRVPVHRRGRDPSGNLLTLREQQVARLVASGCTNRSIADELYLSEKTVERHVSHLFLKLNVRNRAAVAATVARA